MDIEELYKQYCLRLKHSLLIALLLLLLLLGLGLLTYQATLLQDDDPSSKVARLSATAVFTLSCAVLLTATCVQPIFRRLSLPIAVGVWLLVLLTIYTHRVLTERRTTMDDIPAVYLVIIVVYTMLPLPTAVAVLLGVISGVSQIAVCLIATNAYKDHMVQQLITNAVIFICANLVGTYHKCLNNVGHRRTFTDSRHCIESRIRLEHERQQQEQLLLSVMPVHLAVELKNRMLNKLKSDSVDNPGRKRSPYGRFHEIYMKVHENVSILYADIVNFTPLASSCTAPELVRMLNQLFGKFDQLAEANDCMRIKILGDCYYCVSGLPVSRPNHAKNCVNMGLQMIDAIRQVRDATGVDVDMRIGIHTGAVISGVLGLRKWQYDVWSDDVTLANHMESSGAPGRVHISRTTYMHLGDAYKVDSYDARNKDPVLKEKDMDTFLIIPPEETENRCRGQLLEHSGQRASSQLSKYLASWGAATPFSHLMDATTVANNIAETSVAMMQENLVPLSCSHDPRNWCRSDEIHPVLLTLRDIEGEWQCLTQPDPGFKFHVLCVDVIFLCMATVHAIMLPRHTTLYVTCGLTFPFLVGVTLVCLAEFLGGLTHCHKKCFALAMQLSGTVTNNVWLRVALMFLSCVYMLVLGIVSIADCDIPDFHSPAHNSTVTPGDQKCAFPAYYLATCLMALTSCHVFFGMNFMVKVLLMVIAVVFYNIVFHLLGRRVFHAFDNDFYHTLQNVQITSEFPLDTSMQASLYFALFVIICHILDRQIEYTSKLDYVWKTKFSVEKEEVETMGSLNKVLLENSLPAHVADHYLNAPHRVDELYHETYSNICVMFASIPNFWDFYQQTTISKHGIECLRLLNEIIGEFDQLLSKPKYSSIEKIKTIGSTYMAASGLQRSRHTKRKEAVRTDHHIITLADVALTMMNVLEGINKDSFNQFKLRIGLNHGPVIAGVIGAKKPQYDIWGDTVNISSRMDSFGALDRIHCPEATADVLINAGFKCECRGPIRIKGKEKPIVTYLVRPH